MKKHREMIRKFERMGWTVTQTKGKGHLRFEHPQALAPVTVSSSPSDHRAWLNVEAQMRRALRLAGAEEVAEQMPRASNRSASKRSVTKNRLVQRDRTKRKTKEGFARPEHSMPVYCDDCAERLPAVADWCPKCGADYSAKQTARASLPLVKVKRQLQQQQQVNGTRGHAPASLRLSRPGDRSR